MARLFIIGNGFDLAHGYATKYSNFHDWMIGQLDDMGISKENLEKVPEIPFSAMGNHGEVYDRKELLKLLMWLLQYGSPIDEEWNEFETALHDLDLQAVFDEATMLIDDGSDNDDYEISSSRRDKQLFYAEQDYLMYADALRDALYMIKELFSNWINTVEIGREKIAFGWDVICNQGRGASSDDIFINFNYTETLEEVYGIPGNQVFHLHGLRKRGEELIVGHGDDSERSFNTLHTMAADSLEKAIRNLRKDTYAVLYNNAKLWKQIKDSGISEVYTFGFSFSNVDLPYIERIAQLLRVNSNVTWHLSARDHGSRNDSYMQIIRNCGFTGSFDEYMVSKKLLSISHVAASPLDAFDRSEKLRFYYDESNFSGKFYLQEKNGRYNFNSDIDRDFVLAGIVTKDEDINIDRTELLKNLGLQKTVKEIKFKTQFSEDDFIRTLHRKRLNKVFELIEERGLYIHVEQVNMFYYAIVDIIDSAIDFSALHEYAESDFKGDIRFANLHLKQLIYDVLHEKSSETLEVFKQYGYPDIEEADIQNFCNDIVGLFGNRWELSTELKYVSGMIKGAGKNGDLLFLRGNDKNIMVDDLAQFYLHFVALFRKSKHIFDEQKEMIRWFEQYIFIDEKERLVDNYSFVNSQTDILVQLSDVVSGICGQMYEYLNKTMRHHIARDVEAMDDQQILSAKNLCSLIHKSSDRNKGFIFSITAQKIRDRLEYFADQVTREFNKREL